MMGMLWTFVPLALHAVKEEGASELRPATFLTVAGSLVAVAFALAYVARKALMKTAFNRRLSAVVLLALLSQVLVRLGIIRLELPPSIAFPFLFYTWFIIVTLVSITLEWRFWPSAVGYLIAAIFLVFFPDAPIVVMALANGALTANAAVVWLPMVTQSRRSHSA